MADAPFTFGNEALISSPAGLSVRWPLGNGPLMTALTRWRTFFAIADLACHIGVSTASTSPLVRPATYCVRERERRSP